MLPELKRYAFLAVVLAVVALSAIGLDALQSSHEAQVAAVSSAAGDTTNTAGSVSAELGKLTGSLYQNATAPQSARAPEAAQASAASQRAALMKGLAETNPAAFLGYALPKEVRAKLPTSVRAQVEEYKTLTGEIEVLHIDDFENHKNSKFKYFLRVGGKRLALYAAQDLPALLSGSAITVKGYQLGDIIVTTGGPAEITVRKAAKPESVGNQRTLVILLKAAGVTPSVTQKQLREQIFSGPFQQFYKEQSYDKVRFSGTVTKWIDIEPYPVASCAYLDVLPDRPEIKNYLLSNGIAPSGYDRIVFVLDNTSGGCSWVGKIDVLFNSQTFRASLAWVGWPSSVYSFPTIADFDYALSHEVGHSLGVMHANAWHCSGYTLYENCEAYEYGNRFDVMGLAVDSAHFNALYKDWLGWFRSADKKVITGSGTFTLAPLEATGGVRTLILKNPALDTEGFAGFGYLEYRQPIGFDRSLPLETAGIFVNYIARLGLAWYAPSALLINANQTSSLNENLPALMPGGSFIDARYGVTLDSVTLSTTTASVRVQIGQPACELRGITIPYTWISTDTVEAGSSGYLVFRLFNSDFPACSTSNLSGSTVITDGEGWSISPATYEFQLSPVRQQLVYIYFYVPVDAPSGTHTITSTVNDTTHNRTYTIEKTFTVTRPSETVALTSLDPSTGAAGTRVVVNGSGFMTSNTVHVGTQSVTATSSSVNSLAFNTPAALTPGTYDVSVENGNGTSNALPFTVASTTGFSIGDRVQTTARLVVRDAAGGTRLGAQKLGALGIITDGPTKKGKNTWWQVDWKTGKDGWSVEQYLQ